MRRGREKRAWGKETQRNRAPCAALHVNTNKTSVVRPTSAGGDTGYSEILVPARAQAGGDG